VLMPAGMHSAAQPSLSSSSSSSSRHRRCLVPVHQRDSTIHTTYTLVSQTLNNYSKQVLEDLQYFLGLNTSFPFADAHCKVQEAAHSQPAKRKPTKLYDLQCRASRRLLQLLAALGSGQLLGETTPEQNPVSEGDFSDEEQLGLSDAATDGAAEGPAAAAAAAAGAFPSVNQEEVTRKLDSLLEEVMEQCLPNGKKYKPDPFQVNCIMAVLADRGELGLCLPDVADLLPHDTPGSRCWFEKEFAQQARQVRVVHAALHTARYVLN